MTLFVLSFTEDRRTDRAGRRQFVLEWDGPRGRRGQYFFAVPEECVRRLWRDGHSVEVGTSDRVDPPGPR